MLWLCVSGNIWVYPYEVVCWLVVRHCRKGVVSLPLLRKPTRRWSFVPHVVVGGDCLSNVAEMPYLTFRHGSQVTRSCGVEDLFIQYTRFVLLVEFRFCLERPLWLVVLIKVEAVRGEPGGCHVVGSFKERCGGRGNTESQSRFQCIRDGE